MDRKANNTLPLPGLFRSICHSYPEPADHNFIPFLKKRANEFKTFARLEKLIKSDYWERKTTQGILARIQKMRRILQRDDYEAGININQKYEALKKVAAEAEQDAKSVPEDDTHLNLDNFYSALNQNDLATLSQNNLFLKILRDCESNKIIMSNSILIQKPKTSYLRSTITGSEIIQSKL